MSHSKAELIQYKIRRARQTYDEAVLLLNNNAFNATVNRLYYACFYAASALLLTKDISPKTHAGTKQMFGLHFISPGIVGEQSGNFYAEIFEMRQEADYEDLLSYEGDEVSVLLEQAHTLISEAEQYISKYQQIL